MYVFFPQMQRLGELGFVRALQPGPLQSAAPVSPEGIQLQRGGQCDVQRVPPANLMFCDAARILLNGLKNYYCFFIWTYTLNLTGLYKYFKMYTAHTAMLRTHQGTL